MGEATTPGEGLRDEVAEHLRIQLSDCRGIMREDPPVARTLRDAWLIDTEGDRIFDALDRRQDARRDYISAVWRKYRGRIEHARPGSGPRQARIVFTRRFRRHLQARWPWCVYCGGHGAEIDHIWPLARLGTNHSLNLVPCCKRCNFEKMDSLVDEWREFRKERSLPWPPRPYWPPEALELFTEQHGVDTPPCGPPCLPDHLQ